MQGTVEHDDKHLIVDGKKIRAFAEMGADKIKWCVSQGSSDDKPCPIDQ
jgi:glyceraldehyde-3-phosphate dehydrogenase/erythrose-4-phosphate dehydrogenase